MSNKSTLYGLLLAAGAAFTGFSQASADTFPQMNGYVMASDDNSATGVWALPTEPGGQWTHLFKNEESYGTFYNGVFKDGLYYVTSVDAQYGSPLVYLEAYDVESGVRQWVNYHTDSNAREMIPYALTLNPVDDRIYGFFDTNKGKNLLLATVDYQDGNKSTLTPIKVMENNWIALAAAPDGNLYGIQRDIEVFSPTDIVVNSSTLYKIDRLTGDATLIGETGQLPAGTCTATIDKRSGRMFWTVVPDNYQSFLCEVNLTTGVATRVMDFEGNRMVGGLYVVNPLAEDDAPATVTDLDVIFEGGELSGTVIFTAPTTLYAGAEAEGPLSYSVMANGVEVARGTTAFGATEEVAVELPERGKYTFLVTVSNSAGTSPKATAEHFVGFGVPEPPANVFASALDGKILITWDAPVGCADGGYLDGPAMTYTVVRTSDNVEIAKDITGTEAEMVLDPSLGLQSYIFTVTATNHGITSAAGTSNKVVTGSPILPWDVTFDKAESLDPFTIIDSNEDGKTWNLYNDCVRVQYGTKVMNDWLITPELNLKAGNTYRVTFVARSSNDRYPERIEAMWGSEPVAGGMVKPLVEATQLPGTFTTLEGFITPEADGAYYVGLHGISDADMYNLEVKSLSIEAGISLDSPAAPEALSAEADTDGDYKATVKLTAPLKNLGGGNLTAIDKIELKRGQELIHTFTEVTPGQELSFTDDSFEKGGDYTYSVCAYLNGQPGREVSTSVFVGTPRVAAPAAVTLSEATPGEVTINWEAVTTSADGKAINPARVRYNIYNYMTYGTLIEENVEGTSFTFSAVEPGKQELVQFSVSAVTDGGESAATTSPRQPAGTPYDGWAESFADAKASTLYLAENLNYGNWGIMNDNYSDVKSQDGDGGCIAMNGYFAGYYGSLTTGKITLKNMEAPVLRFYSYTPDNTGEDLNTLSVSVSADNGEYEEVFRKTVVEIGATEGWHEVIVPLGAYAGKVVTIRFIATTYERPYTSTYLDNLSVASMEGIELEVKGVSAPLHVRAGEDYTVAVQISNNGASDARGAQVELWADDELVATGETEVVPGLGAITHEMNLTMHPLTTTAQYYSVVVNHSDDFIAENNRSEEFMVNVLASPLPAPAALKAEKSGENSVALSWEAPEQGIPGASVTDGFDNTMAWVQNAPGWAFVDVDGAPIAGFGEVEFPGVVAGTTRGSFIVFSNADVLPGNKWLTPHSGSQYLVAMCRYDNGTTDDWAISPELSGEAQTISFYARSYSASYPERIEVYYSTGSLMTSEFIATDFVMAEVPNAWTLCEVTLPEGARHFAIRSCATNSFMLMIDDATFIPAASRELTLQGYNVYRNREKLNSAPVALNSFTDNIIPTEEHVWNVTAVYAEGESYPSESATVNLSGISSVEAENISIRGERGAVAVSGAEGEVITVAAADGRLMHNGEAKRLSRIELPSGVYVVRVASTTAKVVVK